MLRHTLFAMMLVTAAMAQAPSPVVQVPCAIGGAACGEALQAAIADAGPGATIVLDPGKVYEGHFVIRPKPGAARGRRLTITTRGWVDKGEGWNGLVTPADKPRLAVLRAVNRENAAVEIRGGEGGGHVTLFGLAFEANPPAGQGDIIRIGSGEQASVAGLPADISIRQVLIQGDRQYGQKRGIAANGRDIEIRQVWCEEVFIHGQDAQCIAGWNGSQRVRVRHAYLAAGAENVLIGGSPIVSPEMEPSDWLIEDVILHKPLRWQQDGANRQVKNLLEFKQGRNITARRVLAVNNWKAGQDGTGLLIHYTTTGRCPQCRGLENVLVEDFVMLNVGGGISLQGYSHSSGSHNDKKLLGVTVRNAYIESTTGTGRNIAIGNVSGRHDIRIERSTFVNERSGWFSGTYGRVWTDPETLTRGGPMAGLWILDNVITDNGRYGITAPDGHHYGTGIGEFVSEDLQIAGNVLGDAPASHLDNYNRYAQRGPENISVSSDRLRAQSTGAVCTQFAPGKGADCARLAPLFALLRRLPEP